MDRQAAAQCRVIRRKHSSTDSISWKEIPSLNRRRVWVTCQIWPKLKMPSQTSDLRRTSVESCKTSDINSICNKHRLHPQHHKFFFDPAEMADKMDVDAVNGEKEEETVGPAPDLPPERSTYT